MEALPSGKAAIPRSGNINFFPNGALQLDDVTAQGLGPLGNFGKVATINRSLCDSDVLFGWTVKQVQESDEQEGIIKYNF